MNTQANEFRTRVRAALLELIGTGRKCVAAISGGPDSTALVRILAESASELGLNLALAHLDHAVREESISDAEWVEDLAEKLDLPLFSERVDVPALRDARKITLEEAARRARYEFLEKIACRWEAAFVATGHNADDQAETILFRIMRGTGLAGLAGMPQKRPLSLTHPKISLVRPMLEVSREQVLAYLREIEQDFLTDETNFDVESQSRARIRHQLLPLMEREHNPDIRGALLQLAVSARSTQTAIEEAAAEYLDYAEPWINRSEGNLRLPLELFEAPQPIVLEILASCARRLGVRRPPNRGRLAQAASELPDAQVGKRFDIGELVAIRDYRTVIVKRPDPLADENIPYFEVPLNVPGKTELPIGTFHVEKILAVEIDMDEYSLTKTGNEEVLDIRVLPASLQLVCRLRRPGDRFHPLGAPGEKKLKEFFIDEKIPQRERDSIPLVVCGESIIWVVGHRLSELARVPENANEVIRIRFEPRH